MDELFKINDIDPVFLAAERHRVRELLSKFLEDSSIHEVGSTAVEGLIGKQDIDFLVRVPLNRFIDTREILDEHFKRDPNQLSNDIYQGYSVDSSLDAAIQLTVIDCRYDNFLEFLKQLETSSELRSRYNKLKREYDNEPMSRYRDAKQVFIEQTLNKQ